MSVLVIGGCGFLGFEVVCLLATEPGWTICVMSRNPEEPRVDGISTTILVILRNRCLTSLARQDSASSYS